MRLNTGYQGANIATDKFTVSRFHCGSTRIYMVRVDFQVLHGVPYAALEKIALFTPLLLQLHASLFLLLVLLLLLFSFPVKQPSSSPSWTSSGSLRPRSSRPSSAGRTCCCCCRCCCCYWRRRRPPPSPPSPRRRYRRGCCCCCCSRRCRCCCSSCSHRPIVRRGSWTVGPSLGGSPRGRGRP